MAEPPPAAHVVQFYEGPDSLCSVLGVWLASTLRMGGGTLLLTGRSHWNLAKYALAGEGFSHLDLCSSGRLVVVDAEGFLDCFMRNGEADPQVFWDLMGPLLRGLRATCGRAIRVWGEAVELLRVRGEIEAAGALEVLWNQAVEQEGLSLLCSYRVDPLDPQTMASILPLVEVHTGIVPDPDEPGLDGSVWSALVGLYGEQSAHDIWVSAKGRGSTGRAVLMAFTRDRPQEAQGLYARVREIVTDLRQAE